MRDYIITVDESEEELMHYGVVGMRWHHRKAADYRARADSYNIAAATSWTRFARNSAKAKEAKYRAKAKKHLDKNRENIKAGNYDKTKGKKYTKVTTKNMAAGMLRNTTKDTLKSLAAIPFTMPLYAGASGAVEGLKRGGLNKQGINAAKRFAKESFKDTVNAELKFAKDASYRVRKRRERNAYANTYGLPKFTDRQRKSAKRGRDYIDI